MPFCGRDIPAFAIRVWRNKFSRGGHFTADTVRTTRTKMHWPEYFGEAALLGIFMLSACLYTALLEHPSAMANQILPEPWMRRIVMGVAMGGTAIALICSPWGQRTGAHFNPAVTLTYWTLGKIAAVDALMYAVFQFAGGWLGVLAARAIAGSALDHPSVNYAVTLPGPGGPAVAFAAEAILSFLLMSVVLRTANSQAWAKFTPLAAGMLVAVFIAVEAPLSGMSMNPARTFSSASVAQEPVWPGIYFVAPPAGMLAAAALYRLQRGAARVFCAKLHHHNQQTCIFRCNYGSLNER